jgi:hypothetical protein
MLKGLTLYRTEKTAFSTVYYLIEFIIPLIPREHSYGY